MSSIDLLLQYFPSLFWVILSAFFLGWTKTWNDKNHQEPLSYNLSRESLSYGFTLFALVFISIILLTPSGAKPDQLVNSAGVLTLGASLWLFVSKNINRGLYEKNYSKSEIKLTQKEQKFLLIGSALLSGIIVSGTGPYFGYNAVPVSDFWKYVLVALGFYAFLYFAYDDFLSKKELDLSGFANIATIFLAGTIFFTVLLVLMTLSPLP